MIKWTFEKFQEITIVERDLNLIPFAWHDGHLKVDESSNILSLYVDAFCYDIYYIKNI